MLVRSRIIIPSKMEAKILNKIHEGYHEVSKCRANIIPTSMVAQNFTTNRTNCKNKCVNAYMY